MEQGALQEQLAEARSALAGCLVAGLQSDPEVAGVMKINDIEKCKMYLPSRDHPIVYYFLTNYRYLEETRPIRHKTLVIFIPCNNCNEHKVDPENCEFILDSENRIRFCRDIRLLNISAHAQHAMKSVPRMLSM